MGPIAALQELFESLCTSDKDATVLAVGLPQLHDDAGGVQIIHAESGQVALEMLRVMEIDLVLVPSTLGDMSVTEFADQLLGACPWQRWGMVGVPISDRQEKAIRERSVMGVFEHGPEVEAA